MQQSRVVYVLAAVAIFSFGYVVKDAVDKLGPMLNPSAAANGKTEPKPKSPVHSSQYRDRAIEKLVEAKGAAQGGVNSQDWARLTREVSVSVDMLKTMETVSKQEESLLNSVVTVMGSTAEAWRGLDGCSYNLKQPGCFERVADILYWAGKRVINPHYDSKAASTDVNSKIMLGFDTFAPMNTFRDALKTEIEARKKRGEKFDLVSEMLTLSSAEIGRYLDFVKHG